MGNPGFSQDTIPEKPSYVKLFCPLEDATGKWPARLSTKSNNCYIYSVSTHPVIKTSVYGRQITLLPMGRRVQSVCVIKTEKMRLFWGLLVLFFREYFFNEKSPYQARGTLDYPMACFLACLGPFSK